MYALGRGRGWIALSMLGLVAFLIGPASSARAAVMCPADAADIRIGIAAETSPVLAAAATGAALGRPRAQADADMGPEGNTASAVGPLRRAEALQRRGHHRQAIEVLRDGLARAEADGDRRAVAALSGSLGSSYLAVGAPESARRALERSLEVARQAGLIGIEAVTLNNLGNLRAAEGNPAAALAAYDDGVRRARTADQPVLAARAAMNAAQLLAQRGEHGAAEARMRQALRELERAPADADHALELVAIGRLLRDLDAAAPNGDHAPLAHGLLTRAVGLARAAGDMHAESYALGYLGRLYEDAGRMEDALPLTRQALFLAQTGDAPEVLYLWQWQVGRLLAASGERAGAIAAYEGAVQTLRSIRADLPAYDPETGRSLFREAVGPVFLGLADLLLREATDAGGGRAAQPYLVRARATVEQLKGAELEDYFRDDCVALLQSRIRPIDRLAGRTAVLYPIVLPDRTELLLSLPDGLAHVTVPVSAEVLDEEVHAFRRLLEKVTTWQYLPYAQRLYRRLIRPLEPHLAAAGVDTLVFIPDGALRTIPLAALHDGRAFLVERYAVATEPGLTLLDPHPVARADMRVLLSGLAEAVQGFAPLPHVEAELAAVRDLFGGDILQDEAFVAGRVEEALDGTPYSVVHIASHGRFAGDPEESFVLTYDGRLNMDELEALIRPSRLRDRPVELLTLSACRTAAGDDRAALGLAGAAVKAGARSVLASLWYINDPASSGLVTAFYRELRDAARSKAEALRRAQLTLLADPRYEHAGYWSPFLLIGNWL